MKEEKFRFFLAFTEFEGSLNSRFYPAIFSRPHRGRTRLLIHLTLPGPLHHHPSHPVPLGRHRRPSWARCRNERRWLHRSSSSPDPELFLHHPSWAGCSAGCCSHHHPSHLEPPLGTGRLHVRAAALRRSVLATRGQGQWSIAAGLEARGSAGGRMGGRCIVESWVCRGWKCTIKVRTRGCAGFHTAKGRRCWRDKRVNSS